MTASSKRIRKMVLQHQRASRPTTTLWSDQDAQGQDRRISAVASPPVPVLGSAVARGVCRWSGQPVKPNALGMRHFDVQLIGGIVAPRGQDRRDAHGRGQDAGGYLARLPQRPGGQCRAPDHRQRLSRASRDAAWMAPIYDFLGHDGGCDSARDQDPAREARTPTPATSSTAPITNSAFDYLRDNMAFSMADKAQANPGLRRRR